MQVAPQTGDAEPLGTRGGPGLQEAPFSAPTLEAAQNGTLSSKSKPRNDNGDLIFENPKALRYDMFQNHEVLSESTRNKGSARRYDGA